MTETGDLVWGTGYEGLTFSNVYVGGASLMCRMDSESLDALVSSIRKSALFVFLKSDQNNNKSVPAK